jgi:thioredoxin 2
MMAPHFTEAANKLPLVRFAKVDSDGAPQASATYNIRSIPTLILFNGSVELARISGAMSAPQLTEWIHQHMPKVAG